MSTVDLPEFFVPQVGQVLEFYSVTNPCLCLVVDVRLAGVGSHSIEIATLLDLESGRKHDAMTPFTLGDESRGLAGWRVRAS